ncbi:MAG: alpha/beta fold hydrolase [Pseudomonadota bacterium]
MKDWVRPRRGSLVARPANPTTPNAPLIIFVHGLSSSPAGTWRSMMELCKHDRALDRYSLASYSYPTTLVSWFGARMPTIQELSDGLKSEIATRYPTAEHIVIVCHSLGGVVARHFIATEKKAGRRVDHYSLLLFAVPNNGAKIADFGRHFSLSHHHLRQLGTNSDLILSLNRDWAELGVAESVRTLTVVGAGDRIVEPASGRGAADSASLRTLVHYNHGNITKAKSLDDDRYLTLLQFITGGSMISSDEPNSFTSAQPQSVVARDIGRTGDPLFDILRPEDCPFYLQREIDKDVRSVGWSHLWLSGGSGYGKTSALRHEAFHRGSLIQISLGSYAGASPSDLLWAIAEVLAERAGMPAVRPQADMVATSVRLARQALMAIPNRPDSTVLIEELPISSPNDMSEFFAGVTSLCLELDGMPAEEARVRMGFSSILDPREIATLPAKLRDRVQFRHIDQWGAEDCTRLASLVNLEGGFKLQPSEIEIISGLCNGSPRAIKMAFRRLRSDSTCRGDLRGMLSEVAAELI